MERLINSQFGLNLVSSLARATPPWLGHIIARGVANLISAQRNSKSVRAVRANQWVVAGESSKRESLDEAVRTVFHNSARSVYELHHHLQNPQKAGEMFVFSPLFLELLDRYKRNPFGVVVTGLHIGSFDLALQWICMQWVKPMVLTIPNPVGGRRIEYEIRKRTGMNLQPVSVAVLRQALRYLQQGGVVVTGIDYPVADCDPRPRFFGRPACLPVHHIYLAVKAHVPIVLMINRLESDGKYHVITSSPIQMDHHPDRARELLFNAEKVLTVAEGFIQQTPQQWSIFQPVWPETLDLAQW